MNFLNYPRNGSQLPERRFYQCVCWFFQVPEAGVETSAFEQGNKALLESGGAQGGAIETETDSQGQLKATALEVLQRAWKSLRRLEDLSDDPKESKQAKRAVKLLDDAFRILEGGKR